MEENMEKKKIMVNMFGGLDIEYDGKLIRIPLDVHSITVQFLIILWEAREKGISREKALDRLYGDNEVSDPANSMRVNLFRLRKMLKQLPLPKEEYIIVEHGRYYWDMEKLEVETDTGLFETCVAQAETSAGKEKENFLKRAFELYKGEFLPSLAAERWAAIRTAEYKRNYIAVVTQLYQNYMEQQKYEQAVWVADMALKIYSYESLATMKIDGLMAQGMFQKALDALDDFSQELFQDMGILPSEEMLKRYRAVSSRVGGPATTVNKIKKQIGEDHIEGAYYCPFPSFVDCYRVMHRLSMRNGMPVFLINCSLTDAKGGLLNAGKVLSEQAEILLASIEKTLRIGDVYTRSNDNQFFILLSGLTAENCFAVTDRISKEFAKETEKKKYRLDFRIVKND